MPIRQSLPAQDRKLMPEGRLTGPMPWVIAIMVFLTVLAVASGMALASASAALGSQLGREATVQILAPDPDIRGDEQRSAVAALSGLAVVADARAVPQTEVEALLTPWFGGGDIAADLPLPGLIDVSLSAPASAQTLEILRDRLAVAAPSARVDADGAWLQPVLDAMRSLQWLAAALVMLLAIATAATVVLAARSSLGNHRGTIAIVHLLGGTDLQISRLFQRRMALDATFGAVLGFGGGVVMLALLARQWSALDTALPSGAGFSPLFILMLVAIPMLTVILAVLMARLTIIGALRKML